MPESQAASAMVSRSSEKPTTKNICHVWDAPADGWLLIVVWQRKPALQARVDKFRSIRYVADAIHASDMRYGPAD